MLHIKIAMRSYTFFMKLVNQIVSDEFSSEPEGNPNGNETAPNSGSDCWGLSNGKYHFV